MTALRQRSFLKADNINIPGIKPINELNVGKKCGIKQKPRKQSVYVVFLAEKEGFEPSMRY